MVLKNEKKDEKCISRIQILLNLQAWNLVNEKAKV